MPLYPVPLRVKTIEVKGLFGRYHHTVHLNQAERVTILHGANGVGKTALLRLVDWLLNRPNQHPKTPFQSFDLTFTNGTGLTVRLGPDHTPEIRSVGEPQRATNLVKCHLIETQRLLRLSPTLINEDEFVSSNTVQHYATDLASRISETMAHYGRASQALDQTYPQRVLAKNGPSLSSEELKQRLQALDGRQAQLKELGLIDQTTPYPFEPDALDNLDKTERRAMTLYVQDTEQKLNVLYDLTRRVKLLQDILNQKLRHKRICIDRERGLLALDDKDNPLDLDALSSGEQHELVLHYDLLFSVPRNTLVLIDEPELSLHVTWQKRFIPDLLQIVQAAGLDVLVATHSPFIVGDRSDLMAPLDDNEAA